ncbi:uncharacterized protein BDW70DRAFT_143097 [Aspergillus foveolatus]|uniref:uncharacterized protein n=1 Tax=Aspergillus foveolatus TaxID=210207 RepID=UPI003CCDCFFA
MVEWEARCRSTVRHACSVRDRLTPKATDFTIVTVIFIVLFWDSVSLMTYYFVSRC